MAKHNKNPKSNSLFYLPMGAKILVENIKSDWAEISFYYNNKNYLYRRHDLADTFIASKKDKIELIKRNIRFFELLVNTNFYKVRFKTNIININSR